MSVETLYSPEGVEFIRITTETHRAFDSRGVIVKVEDGVVTQWRLAEGGAWNTVDLAKVQRMLEEADGR